MNAHSRIPLTNGFNPSDDDELDFPVLFSSIEPTPTPAFLTGVRGLMLAVLEDAVRCYVDGKKTVQEEARRWVASNRNNWPFSFVVVCETLRLDPSAVRLKLESLRARKIPSRKLIPRARKNVRVPGRVVSRKPRRGSRGARRHTDAVLPNARLESSSDSRNSA